MRASAFVIALAVLAGCVRSSTWVPAAGRYDWNRVDKAKRACVEQSDGGWPGFLGERRKKRFEQCMANRGFVQDHERPAESYPTLESGPTQEELRAGDFGTEPFGYREQIRAHMESRLFDPSSAEYRYDGPPVPGYAHLRGNRHPAVLGYLVSVQINAKNRYGGYVGYKPHLFLIRNSSTHEVPIGVRWRAVPGAGAARASRSKPGDPYEECERKTTAKPLTDEWVQDMRQCMEPEAL